MSDNNNDKKMPAKKKGELKRDFEEEKVEEGFVDPPTKSSTRSKRGSLRGLDTDDTAKPSAAPRGKAAAGLLNHYDDDEDFDEDTEYDEDYFDDVETGRSGNTEKGEYRLAAAVARGEARLSGETKKGASPPTDSDSPATSNAAAATTQPGAFHMGVDGFDASTSTTLDDETTLADFTVTNQDHSRDILVVPPPQTPPIVSAKLVNDDAVEAVEVVEPPPPREEQDASIVSCSCTKRNVILLTVIGLLLLVGGVVGVAVALAGGGSSDNSTTEQSVTSGSSTPAPVTTNNPTPAPVTTNNPTPAPTVAPTANSPLMGVWSQLGQDIVGTGDGDSVGYYSAISSDGSILAVTAKDNDDNGVDSGQVRVFQWNGSSWAQLGQTLVGENARDGFGLSVSLSSDGSILAVGAYSNDDNGSDSGHVRVFEWNGSSWVQLGQTLVGENAGDEFGYSISLSSDGSILAVGALLNDDNGTNSGHVRVFERNGSSWGQLGQTLVGENAGDWFGYSVSLSSDGSILVVGATDNGDNEVSSKYVRVFERNGSSWIQLGQTLVGENVKDLFGGSISLSSDGSILAVGALLNDDNGTNSGHVRVFQWNGSSWVRLGQALVGENAYDNFGRSVSLSSNGRILAVGAWGNDDNGPDSGHVRVFQVLNGAWTQVASAIPGKGFDDQFGISVALSADGTTVAGGANQFGKSGDTPGYVSVYQLSTIDPTPAPVSTNNPTAATVSPQPSNSPQPTNSPLFSGWSQLGQEIVGTGDDDRFGGSIAISSDGSILAAGARYNDDNGTSSGHVRVFQRNGSSWVQLGQTLVGENAGDLFGYSISLSSDGSILAVAAAYNNDNGTNSGHVRVFQWNGSSWAKLGQTLVGENAGDYFGESISLSSDGSMLAVGASWNDDNGIQSGHVRVLQLTGSSWVQLGQTLVGENAGDESGRSVSLSSDGTILAVGAESNDDNGTRSGHVRVFERNGSSWVQLGQAVVGEKAGDKFGETVSLSSDGTILAAGAILTENGAQFQHVRMFQLTGSSWIQFGQTLVAESSFDYNRESISLSSDGGVLAVGARYSDDNGANSGHVRVFQMLNDAWTQMGGVIPGKGVGDRFGISVALSADGTTVAGGANQFGKSGDPPGYVSVYERQQP